MVLKMRKKPLSSPGGAAVGCCARKGFYLKPSRVRVLCSGSCVLHQFMIDSGTATNSQAMKETAQLCHYEHLITLQVVAQICAPSTLEAKARGWQIEANLGHREF